MYNIKVDKDCGDLNNKSFYTNANIKDTTDNTNYKIKVDQDCDDNDNFDNNSSSYDDLDDTLDLDLINIYLNAFILLIYLKKLIINTYKILVILVHYIDECIKRAKIKRFEFRKIWKNYE